MSFAADVVDAAEPSRLALVAIGRDGARREIGFGRSPIARREWRARWQRVASDRATS